MTECQLIQEKAAQMSTAAEVIQELDRIEYGIRVATSGAARVRYQSRRHVFLERLAQIDRDAYLGYLRKHDFIGATT